MVPEQYCKIDDIQGYLDELIGLDSAASLVPGLFLSIPYANLMDRWGRRPVLLICFLGINIAQIWQLVVLALGDSVDLRWFIAGNLWTIIGGGAPIAVSSLSTIVVDTSSTEKRSRMFMFFWSSALIASAISIPIGAFLMDINLWYPLIFGTGVIFVATSLCFFLPETNPASYYLRLARSDIADNTNHSDPPDENQPLLPPDRNNASVSVSSPAPFFSKSLLDQIFPTFFFKASWTIRLISIACFAVTFARFSNTFLVQLVSIRFLWNFDKAGYILTVYSISTLICLTLVLPALILFATLWQHFPLDLKANTWQKPCRR